ncbi:Sensor histidine kinase CusS [Cupriavidus campinensis]|uniref:Sensor protein n=1 Tax=Cupriavidus campinensis TaxID=151783 RepID=A0ABY3ETV8_9BURK|nr:heavy metal sensor histidine kinase [Cupriavidus campinensis]TSP14413.1 heavy metal sensor histidine kinase [Cupriavidus campinensis]CAG2146399.1 Sensor histidine kinase CusS [Cupriavidus campinensis]
MRRRYSLTTRLTVLFSLSSAVVLLGLAGLILSAMDSHFADEDYALLRDNLRVIQKSLAPGASPHFGQSSQSGPSGHAGDPFAHHAGVLLHLREADGRTRYATPDFDFTAALAARPVREDGEDRLAWQQAGKRYRGLRAAVPAGDAAQPIGVILAMDTDIHEHFLRAFRRSLVLYVALAVLASGLFGWWAARRGLSPLRAMASRAKAVTGDKLDQRMPVEAVPVEMAALAADLNAMLARLQDDFRRLSEFSSDLAHELRTPLTNLMTQTQVALSQPRDAARYRDVLASNVEELQRLSRMVSDMLYLAKMEHGLDLPHKESISIGTEVLALFEFYEALAEDQGIALRLVGDARIDGDRLMLRRALSNLLSNALRYTPEHGSVVVTVTQRAGEVEVAVENDGPGIAPDLLPALFDRFFRGDKSRARPESETVGLGLSITRAIVAAHGGSISVHSQPGTTRFAMQFPPPAREPAAP